VREDVARRLAAVAAGLPDGLTLVVWDGYRPIATQAALFDSYLTELAMVHPDWPADALEDAAARYVTPPSRAVAAPPPHLTGGAVDLTLGDGYRRPGRGRSRTSPAPRATCGAPSSGRWRARASRPTSRSGGTSTTATSSGGWRPGAPRTTRGRLSPSSGAMSRGIPHARRAVRV
jgi:hypothetical protein